MTQQRWFQRFLYLALALPSCGGVLNTECTIEDDAIQSEIRDDQAASVPKVCFDVEDTERCFYLLLPDCSKDRSDVPLVVDLHDTGACPVEQSRMSGWKEYALAECFAVAWPLGTTDADVADEPCFSVPGGIQVTDKVGDPLGIAPDCCCKKDGRFIPATSTNDVVFLHQMISRAIDEASSNDVTVNVTRVQLTGYGTGATAAMGFTAMHSEVVACLAPFSGAMVTQFPGDYSPVPVFSVMDTANTELLEDQKVSTDELSEELIASPIGDGPHILPSPSRVDGYFASANHCGTASSRSNVATDKLTKKEGLVTGGKYASCEEPVNFLKPPFAAYKARDTVQTKAAVDVGQPINRVVDTTGIALLFCKDRQSVSSAYQFPETSTATSYSALLGLAISILALAFAS